MTKGKKTKHQKKKFFAHPKNQGKVFKKKDRQPKEKKSPFRIRNKFELVAPPDGIEVPKCIHGPCLLIGTKDSTGNVVNQFFTCAIFRQDPSKCSFRAEIERGKVVVVDGVEHKWDDMEERPKPRYNLINKKFLKMLVESKAVWCPTCIEVFENKHNHPGRFITQDELKHPSTILETLDNPSGEAQYFFSEESVEVIAKAVASTLADSIVCIGAPRLFEYMKNEGVKKRYFMLDYDRRYARFYKSTQFAQYSMLNHFFYDDQSEEKLHNFLKNAKSLAIVCDPPFGVFVEPLMQNILKLKKVFVDAGFRNAESNFFCIMALPRFVGKRTMFIDKSFYMHDYRVTYENHKVFSNPEKTSVRLFTNINPQKFRLGGVPNYKLCDNCDYWVHETNKHCFMCMRCTMTDSHEVRHCNKCSRCYKLSYKHCNQCQRCHIAGACRTKEEMAAGGLAGNESDEE